MGSPMVDVEVKYGREVVTLTMMLSSTIGDLKAELQTKTGVPTEKQRLMFSAPVVKEYRREAKNDVTMESMVPPSLRKSVEEHQGSVAQHIKVSAMMIGRSGAEVPQVDSRATSEVSRLVTTTTQHNGLWYRCSYGSGYVRQTAYLCRTCVESGRAEADHSICLACASICHGNHEVEEWGVRSYMRCDCCTIRCSKVTNTNGAAASPPLTKLELEPSVVQTISSADVAKRSKRRRSRSSSPLTPKRTGGSPMSGFRVSASTGPSPFSLMDPPPNEQRAISSPIVSASQARQAEVAVQQRCADNVVEPEPFPAATDTGADGVVEKAANDESDIPPLPEFPRCCFIVDKETEKPPANAVIPPNRRNRYPRKSTKWCFCEDDHPSDDPDYSGIVCMLCTTCFWSTHMTRLMADQYRRLPCYGDVVSGDTLAFNCDTCKVQVCAPCRFRCHKDHNITEIITVPTEEGPNPDMPFSCGCRSRCLISDSVPPEDVDDEMHYMPIPNDVAIELMNDDVFTGFICSYCMQENPWILENDFAKCYQGQLPPKYTGALLPPPPCGAKSGEPLPEGYYPYHGMIFPTQGFSAEMICSCEPCQKAMHDFAPCATEDAANMVAKLHDSCDNCGKLMKEGFSYICQTCEMTESSSFFVCEECYQIRCRLVAGQNRIFPIGGPVETPGAPGSASATPEPPTESTAVQEASPSDPSLTFQHDLAHQFVEDTKDNLTTICVMQMAQNLDAIDPELMEWITNEGGSIPTDALQMTFGQTPIEFSQEELDDFASMNTNQSHPPAKSASTKSPAKKHK